MTQLGLFETPFSAIARAEPVCWTKMHAEAGEGLEQIIQRKELERRSGKGQFFWGIGNAVDFGLCGPDVSRIRVIFSKMISKPKPSDVSPRVILVWRKYISLSGVRTELPAHALITSRGHTAMGPKLQHFALVCQSSQPLKLDRGRRFDPTAHRNLGGQNRKPGFSQVTSLLTKVSSDVAESRYFVDMEATLVRPFIIKLVDPIAISTDEHGTLLRNVASPKAWLKMVRHLREESGQGRAA